MTRNTFRSAIYRGPGKVDLLDKPYPECGDDDIVIRNLLTGVCGSDISAYHHGGDDVMIWKDHEFGHESISEVAQIGKNVRGLKLGDHVFPIQGQALRDMTRMSTTGGFSEFIRVPQCELGFSVLKIDNAIPVETGVLFEPFLVGTRAAKNLNPGPDKPALVFGAGIIGICTAIMLRWFGSPKVMIVDIAEFRLEKAREFGLVTCNSATEDLSARAFEEFGSQHSFLGERCSVPLYVDAVGKKVALDSFAALACRDATIGVVGVHHEPVAIDLVNLCYNNWRMLGCGTASLEEAAEDIFAMMMSKQHDLSSLVTHEFKVDQIVDALIMGTRTDQAQKVCVSF